MTALSWLEKLDCMPALAALIGTVLWALVTSRWRNHYYPSTLLLHVGYAAMRKATSRFSVAQLQYLLPTTDNIYQRFVQRHRLPSKTVDLSEGALGHWLGDDEHAEYVLIWYHGGGFALPANDGYFHFFTQLLSQVQSMPRPKSLAIFTLTYTLAPQATYPTQIRQALSALQYILRETDRSPSQILLGGDSAGGNLVGAVLTHLTHPHPDLPPLSLSPGSAAHNIRGAIMIAPWTSLDQTILPEDIASSIGVDESQIDSRGDIITPAVGGPWVRAYMGAGKHDYYTDLSTAPADWFASFPVENVLVCAGGREILLPFIIAFAKIMQEGLGAEKVELCVGEGEGHVAPIYNLALGEWAETIQGRRVKDWLVEVL
ncbi:lipase/thioesterase family protein [Aspergillus saccharolyticus JOP 1030-1]|uniref:Lipase/thioesterase family protein n=1 Tax=Aspergillus saccharolyticus JOP 1030-1 TaxID=1450539 RepID=A0A318ZDV1_9EURO|nr:lipase/thioesterase family protein [Aspergillus saccharolyticus JOP 1030-1]PYH44777.1 lipase/thioesterase family protein [Aspergillus saccharolyticus JOP 1030-1]